MSISRQGSVNFRLVAEAEVVKVFSGERSRSRSVRGTCWVGGDYVGADYVLALSESRYLRPEGWEAFFSAMEDYFVALVLKRDSAGSKSPGIPIFAHTYDCPQPRPSQAGPGIGPCYRERLQAIKFPKSTGCPSRPTSSGNGPSFQAVSTPD